MRHHKLGLLAGLMCCFLGSAWAEPAKLLEGTEVRLRMMDTLSSATAIEGQRFNLELEDDVTQNGKIIVAHGAKAVGTVLGAHKRGHMGKAGELNMQVDYLLVGEQRVRLRASTGREGDSKVGSTVALTVLFGPLGLLKRGKDIVVNAGTPITAYIDQTVVLNESTCDTSSGCDSLSQTPVDTANN